MKMSTVKLESFIRVIILDQVVLLETENVTWHSKVSLLGYYLLTNSDKAAISKFNFFFHVLKQFFLKKGKIYAK